MSALKERFWAKVEKTEGCWEWTASKWASGYGQISVGRRMEAAHRVSYELAFGAIPDGLAVDHICRNKGCVRPSHLRPATHKQNMENRGAAHANNASGVRGISWHRTRGQWFARVGHDGRSYFVGAFADLELAKQAVTAKRNELFTHNDADRGVTA
jgi:hypothetical protein